MLVTVTEISNNFDFDILTDKIQIDVFSQNNIFEFEIKEQFGIDGKSAYKSWLDQGNIGSEQDFLDSLIGDLYLLKEAAEAIPSFTPIAVISNKAYKYDNLNVLHQFAFAGFSVNGCLVGETVKIKQLGEISLQNWQLVENTQYLAGANGQIVTNNNSQGFTKVIGFSTNSNTLQIIKDYTSILKN